MAYYDFDVNSLEAAKEATLEAIADGQASGQIFRIIARRLTMGEGTNEEIAATVDAYDAWLFELDPLGLDN